MDVPDQPSAQKPPTLSHRGRSWADKSKDLLIWQIVKDLWHPQTNPGGYVSLGIADNSLMHSELRSYVNNHFNLPTSGLTYGDGGSGSKSLQTAMAGFLTQRFNPANPVLPSDVTITNGVSTAIEHIASIVTDPGDVFLLGRPYYRAFIGDIALRTGVQLVPVSFGEVDPFSVEAVPCYEAAVNICMANNQKVAGIMLCNPHNPLGRCYSKDTLVELMKICHRHRIHLVSDEIYAMSIFGSPSLQSKDSSPDNVPFTSLLSIPKQNLIDSSLTHVLYGLSKDFGANGVRIGCIISQSNPEVHQALIPVTKYSYASSLAESTATTLLQDSTYLDWYLCENRRRLESRYNVVRAWADRYNIRYLQGVNAALFLWINLGEPFQRKLEREGGPRLEDAVVDSVLSQVLLEHRVFVGAGSAFGSEKAGWFRMTFSLEERSLLEGLKRVEKALGLIGCE